MQRLLRSQITTLSALILWALMCGACDKRQLWDWATGEHDISNELRSLERADRLVITREHEVIRETSRPDDIAAVFDLIHKYPNGWKVVSGAFGDYEINFYRQNEFVGRVGLTTASRDDLPGVDTVHVYGAFRQIPKADVSALAMRLGLKWPTR